MPVYIKKGDVQNEFILGDINPENLIGDKGSKNVIKEREVNLKNGASEGKDKTDKQEIEIVKIDLDNEEHALYLSNIVFFDNQNKTLPIGMDLSSKVLIKLDNTKKKFREKQEIYLIDKINDFEVKKMKIKVSE